MFDLDDLMALSHWYIWVGIAIGYFLSGVTSAVVTIIREALDIKGQVLQQVETAWESRIARRSWGVGFAAAQNGLSLQDLPRWLPEDCDRDKAIVGWAEATDQLASGVPELGGDQG